MSCSDLEQLNGHLTHSKREVADREFLKVVNDCSYSHRYTTVNLAGFIVMKEESKAAERT